MKKKETRPLRRIVRTEIEEVKGTWGMAINRIYEVLECGHRVSVRKDFYGETNAYRRRCRFCQKPEQTT